MISIALVEDNWRLAEQEEKCIKDTWSLEEELELFTYHSAENFMREGHGEFDILILDIGLPDMSGINLAKWVRSKGTKVCIVFLTAHGEFALQSYQLEVAHYILKTEMEQRLPRILRQIGEHIIATRVRYRILEHGSEMIKICLDDILYFYKDGKYVHFVTQEGIYKERTGLDKVFDEMGGFPLVKIERGFVVNAMHVNKVLEDRVCMKNKEELPVSRRMLPNVKRIINLHSRELKWE